MYKKKIPKKKKVIEWCFTHFLNLRFHIYVYFVCDIRVKSCSFDKQGHII